MNATADDGLTPRPYELMATGDGFLAKVHVRGNAVLASPTINRGMGADQSGLATPGVAAPGAGSGQRPRTLFRAGRG